MSEALLGLAIDDRSVCNLLKLTISRCLSTGELDRCLELRAIENVIGACVFGQFDIFSCLAQPFDVRSTRLHRHIVVSSAVENADWDVNDVFIIDVPCVAGWIK